MTLFTVQLELGPETRAMVEKLATNTRMHFEFGPKTLATLKSLFPKQANKRDGGEGLLKKGADALRK
jgi:hypothetical protein